jgi:Ca-activated chloride channel family protein
VVALVALLFALESRANAAIERILGPAMRARLVVAPSAARRRFQFVLLGLCGICLVVALMRPQWGFRHFAAPRVGADIMVALDVSRSMLAEDVAPNRLARAKAEIADLLSFLDGDQVGLIAFAGRASVLCPLTPDFGFLRTVLEVAGPASVTRGGTKMAEPIRKAVAGFGPAGEASRAILLVTDGEDHDSFVLDAAREAAEADIKIIAIGFGDEAGSEIPLTDPRTGARTLVLDTDGQPVRSRLDGDLLREIALATDGAYVPAGTGVLDLESIYEHHIARLTRGRLEARGHTVRDEHYQWPLLLGLVFLVSSVLVAAGPLTLRALAIGLLLFPLAGPPAGADEAALDRSAGGRGDRASSAAEGGAEADQETQTEAEKPREIYNRGVAALEGSAWQDARHALERARAEARGDGELRFRTSYNLGVAAAKEAEELEPEQPREALASLNRAAAWFQEAVTQRPKQEDARHNLEVTLRQALLLEDRLARERENDLEGELEALAGRQRGIVASAAALLDRTEPEAVSDPHAVDRYRAEYASQATAQRTLLSDADTLAERIADEWAALDTRADSERTAEERMRSAQMAAVLEHLHSARERMGQARSQLRRRQGKRAYRRASAALADLKRARDPLRDPVSLLDAVIGDASEVAAATELLAAAGREIPGLDRPLEPPVWLSREALQDLLRSIVERTGELHARLRAGLDSPIAEDDAAATNLLGQVREAEPFVDEAREQLELAAGEVGRGALDAAGSSQRKAIAALLEARERFLDVRGLIEAAYAAQRQIQAVLRSEADAGTAVHGEYLASLREAQKKNRERGQRIAEHLEDAFPAVLESGGNAPGAAGDMGDPAEHLRRARDVLTAAISAMSDAERALERGSTKWKVAGAAADQTVDRLEDLRRLFFSIGERVRELAERQLEIADATQDAAALKDASPPAHQSEALAARQKKLAAHAGEVALDLAAQSDTAAAGEAPDAEDSARRLRAAGEHVLWAENAMKAAAAELGGDPVRAGEAQGHQQEALRELGEALALLAPPDSRGAEEPERGESQDGGSEAESGDGQRATQAASSDPAQLLQAVRDREAQRQRSRSRAPRAGYEPVEKDW